MPKTTNMATVKRIAGGRVDTKSDPNAKHPK